MKRQPRFPHGAVAWVVAVMVMMAVVLMKGRGRTPSKDQSDTLDSVIASISTKRTP